MANPEKTEKIAIDKANQLIKKNCAAKKFVIESGRGCPKVGATAPVDLVLLIDTSESMQDEAKDLSDAAAAAIKAAEQSCPCNLQVKWLGIEGTWADTNFAQSLRAYLNKLGIKDEEILSRKFSGKNQEAKEDGARAIQDISKHFDWRPGAARAIFYLGDEALEGGNPQNADDITAANAAIFVAKKAAVKVHTYLGTGIKDETTEAEYKRVATETGGQAFVAPVANIGGFQVVLKQIICASSQTCKRLEIPEIIPYFELRWGDSSEDRIETDDVETIYLTAYNFYSNVTIKDLNVVFSVVAKSDGNPVANLPDGTPSVVIKPSSLIDFGDLPPCNPQNKDELSGISRELVLLTRGAARGDYLFKIDYYYSTEFNWRNTDQFALQLVAS